MGDESQVRTDGLRLVRAPLWPTELSRCGTPPGIRTRNRSLRRRLRYPLCANGVRFPKESDSIQCRPGDSNPTSARGKSPVLVLAGASGKWTRPQLATSESNRALPPYQSGPFDRLGRGQRKTEASSPAAWWPPQAFKARCRAGGASSILVRRAADSNRNAVTPIRIRNGARSPDGFTLHRGSPARCEQAGGSRGRRNRIPRQYCRRPVSSRGQPPGWFILHEQKAADSNGTV